MPQQVFDDITGSGLTYDSASGGFEAANEDIFFLSVSNDGVGGETEWQLFKDSELSTNGALKCPISSGDFDTIKDGTLNVNDNFIDLDTDQRLASEPDSGGCLKVGLRDV